MKIIGTYLPWMGTVRYSETNDGAVINANTIRETPLYKAGLDIDDIITAVDGHAVTKSEAVQTALTQHKPGDIIRLSYKHRGEAKIVAITLVENPSISVQLYEDAGLALSSEMQQFRNNWLNAKNVN